MPAIVVLVSGFELANIPINLLLESNLPVSVVDGIRIYKGGQLETKEMSAKERSAGIGANQASPAKNNRNLHAY